MKIVRPKSRVKRRELMRKYAGIWKGTELDNDELWKSVLTRKSRPVDWLDKLWPKEWLKN